MAWAIIQGGENSEIKYFVVGLCILLIVGGLYFKFLYDVPDGQEKTNNFVSWLLVVIGITGMMIAALWKSKNPLTSFENGNEIHFTKKNNKDDSKDSGTTNADSQRRKHDLNR